MVKQRNKYVDLVIYTIKKMKELNNKLLHSPPNVTLLETIRVSLYRFVYIQPRDIYISTETFEITNLDRWAK